MLFAKVGENWMPLDVEPALPIAVVGLVAYNPASQGGVVLGVEHLRLARHWRDRHGVTFHRTHFETCAQAAEHRRERTGGRAGQAALFG